MRTIQYLSHDPAVVKDNEADQLIRRSVSLRAVDDMLSRVCWSVSAAVRRFNLKIAQGENLVVKDYKKWPTALPVRLHF
jgi:hypothetical protein